MFLFFTELLKKDVVDRYGRYLGSPYDFFADLSESYPKCTALVVTSGTFQKKFLVIPWSQLHIVDDEFRLKGPFDPKALQKSYVQEGTPTFRKNILDQQVVDTFNRKVVRVNDLHFLSVGGELRLAHVDVGVRGLVRRLGWEKFVDPLVRLVNRHALYLTTDGFIAWKYIQPLSIRDASGRVRLNVDQESLRHIPPSDISEMLMELNAYERAALLRTLDVDRQVDIVTELDLKWQRDLIEDLDTKAAVALFERMPADEATDLLQALSKRDVARIMGELSIRKARELSGLLKHETDSAGGLMTTEYFVLTPAMTVGAAIELMRQGRKQVETIQSTYVVDEEKKLVGVVTMRMLLLAPLDMKIETLMLRSPPALNVNDTMKDIAYAFDKYNLFVAPVVNDQEVLEGIITVDDVFSIVIEELWGERSAIS